METVNEKLERLEKLENEKNRFSIVVITDSQGQSYRAVYDNETNQVWTNVYTNGFLWDHGYVMQPISDEYKTVVEMCVPPLNSEKLF